MLIVTACNRRYFDGVRVLHNSFRKRSAEGNSFWCLAFGDEQLQNDLQDLGIKVILNPEFPEVELKRELTWLSDRYDDDAIKALYSRILLPSLFPNSKRALWVDADSNFLNSVQELDAFNMKGRPIAAPLTPKRHGVHAAMGHNKQHPYIKTGTLLFDVQEFLKVDGLQRCVDMMKKHPEAVDGSAVEAVINWVFRSQAAKLPDIYCFAGKKMEVTEHVKIIHWSIMEPWNDEMMAKQPQRFREPVERYWKPFDY